MKALETTDVDQTENVYEAEKIIKHKRNKEGKNRILGEMEEFWTEEQQLRH